MYLSIWETLSKLDPPPFQTPASAPAFALILSYPPPLFLFFFFSFSFLSSLPSLFIHYTFPNPFPYIPLYLPFLLFLLHLVFFPLHLFLLPFLLLIYPSPFFLFKPFSRPASFFLFHVPIAFLFLSSHNSSTFPFLRFLLPHKRKAEVMQKTRWG